MTCPKCHGKGFVVDRATHEFILQCSTAPLYGSIAHNALRCDYPGCVEGIIHCCEGDQVDAAPGHESNPNNLSSV